MARINSNIPSVIAHSNFSRVQKELGLRLERLSTGLRINRGADDPAGLIISERLRANIQGVDQGVKNSERASSVISTAEASLSEINDLLNSIKSLIVESANTGAQSAEEREANQQQINSAIDSITRISNSASFGSLKLLNGNLDYQLSGVRTSAIATARVANASFLNNNAIPVTVDVIASAQVGAVYYNGATTPAGVTLSAMTLEVKGPRGVETVSFEAGLDLSTVVNSINNLTGITGVQAALINNNPASGIVFKTTDYGSESFVSVKRIGGPTTGSSWQTYAFLDSVPFGINSPFGWATLIGNGSLTVADRDPGRDVSALVNGSLAAGKGLNISVNSGPLGMQLTLTDAFATRPNASASTFSITGGGSQFQLGGDVNAQQQVNLGIPSLNASSLGATVVNGTIQFLSTLKSGGGNDIPSSVARSDFSIASDILNSAIDEVSVLRGRLGAFGKNVLDPNIRSLQSAFENLSASESQIRDADFAFETSKLTRAQILSSAATSTLGLANQQSQQVLQLLG